MTVANFIPTVWSKTILKFYNDEAVYAALCNRDYEGEIKNVGDTVKINSVGDPTIKSYTRNAGLGAVSEIDAPEILVGSQVVLQITEYDYWNYGVDDHDALQANANMFAEATRRTAINANLAIDDFVSALMTANVPAGNLLTAATSVGTGATDDDAYEVLFDLNTKLTEAKVPAAGRFAVIPPWYQGSLQKDPRFVSFGTVANNGRLTNGLGAGLSIAGMEIHVSNLVPNNGTAYDVLAGVKDATAFANQFTNIEAFRPQGGFADAQKGQSVYGAKVIRPYALAKVVCTAA